MFLYFKTGKQNHFTSILEEFFNLKNLKSMFIILSYDIVWFMCVYCNIIDVITIGVITIPYL